MIRATALLLLTAIVLSSCTAKPKTQPVQQSSEQTTPAIADPTPPDPPSSTEVAPELKNLPAFVTLAVGGLADEGEKEGIKIDDTFRLFRTEAESQQVLAFYQKELRDRGWQTDNQVAKSGTVGLALQEFRHADDVLFLIVGEPEGPQSSDPVQSKRHVVLLSAKSLKPGSSQVKP